MTDHKDNTAVPGWAIKCAIRVADWSEAVTVESYKQLVSEASADGIERDARDIAAHSDKRVTELEGKISILKASIPAKWLSVCCDHLIDYLNKPEPDPPLCCQLAKLREELEEAEDKVHKVWIKACNSTREELEEAGRQYDNAAGRLAEELNPTRSLDVEAVAKVQAVMFGESYIIFPIADWKQYKGESASAQRLELTDFFYATLTAAIGDIPAVEPMDIEAAYGKNVHYWQSAISEYFRSWRPEHVKTLIEWCEAHITAAISQTKPVEGETK